MKNKNVLLLTFQNLNELPGISKKILSQKRAIENLGYHVSLSHIRKNNFKIGFFIENETIISCSNTLYSRINWRWNKQPIFNWIKANNITFIYVRYTKFANASFVWFFKKLKKLGIKIVLEIPTYPYDKELKNTSVRTIISNRLEKHFRMALMKYVDRIVTFSKDETIFGCPTIRIINGVDPEQIELKKISFLKDRLNLLGVASLNFWHGYDRIIEGLKIYYENGHRFPVYFHIVGGDKSNEEYIRLKNLVSSYSLREYVIFHGEKNNAELDEIFNRCQVGIGSLGRHRTNISEFQSLKNIEYGVRGIPFIYSEISTLFDNEKYIYHCPPDETPIDIDELIKFYHSTKNYSPLQIRESCLKKGVDWTTQFKTVFSFLKP